MRLAGWIVRNMVALGVGLVILLTWFEGVSAFLDGNRTALDYLARWFVLSLGFIPAGLASGTIQVGGVLRFLPSIDPGRWVKATVTAGFAGWLLVTIFLVVVESVRGLLELPGAAGIVMGCAMAAVFGGLLGCIVGIMQARAMPFRLAIRFWWPVANAVGWGTAMPILYLGAHLSGMQDDIVVRIGYWLAATGIGCGMIGAVIGTALMLMQVERDLDAEDLRATDSHSRTGV